MDAVDMKLNKENIQVAILAILFFSAIAGFWIWIFYEAITNEPEVFLHLGVWLGPLFVFPILRWVARSRMSEEEKDGDDAVAEKGKGDGLTLVMTAWFIGYPIFYTYRTFF